MGREEHIDFGRLEPGDYPDRQHLAACSDCREAWRAGMAVREMVRRSPSIEPSPFFASRIVHLARTQGPGAWLLFLQQAARRLLPVFALLLLTVGLLTYMDQDMRETSPQLEELLGSETIARLFEEGLSISEMTDEEVFSTLIEMEGGSLGDSR